MSLIAYMFLKEHRFATFLSRALLQIQRKSSKKICYGTRNPLKVL
jgi:hypothetical protein